MSPGMPRATKNSGHVTDTSVYPEKTVSHKNFEAEIKEMEVQRTSFQPSTSQA